MQPRTLRGRRSRAGGRKRREPPSDFKLPAAQEDVRFFESAAFDPNDFEPVGEDAIAVKNALVLVEGHHEDSQGRPHYFSKDRVFRIAQNTNSWFSKGNRVPWLTDHQKTQWSTIGDLDGHLQVRKVRPEDVPGLPHLIGKLGIFTDRLVGKGKDVVQKITDGLISTLSPGLDVAVDVIKEISATPTPAIPGLRIFKRNSRGANFALTWDEAEQESWDEDAAYEDAMSHFDMWWGMASQISQASDEELQGRDPEQLQVEALQGLTAKLAETIGLSEPMVEQETNVAGAPPKSKANALASKPVQMARAGTVAAFERTRIKRKFNEKTRKEEMAITMAQAAYAMYGGGTANFARKKKRRGKATLRQKIMGRTALGTAARLGALAAGGAAAYRYGGRAIGGYSSARKAGLGRLEAAGRGIRKGGQRALRDIKGGYKNTRRAADAVAGGAYAGAIGAYGGARGGGAIGLSGVREAMRGSRGGR